MTDFKKLSLIKLCFVFVVLLQFSLETGHAAQVRAKIPSPSSVLQEFEAAAPEPTPGAPLETSETKPGNEPVLGLVLNALRLTSGISEALASETASSAAGSSPISDKIPSGMDRDKDPAAVEEKPALPSLQTPLEGGAFQADSETKSQNDSAQIQTSETPRESAGSQASAPLESLAQDREQARVEPSAFTKDQQQVIEESRAEQQTSPELEPAVAQATVKTPEQDQGRDQEAAQQLMAAIKAPPSASESSGPEVPVPIKHGTAESEMQEPQEISGGIKAQPEISGASTAPETPAEQVKAPPATLGRSTSGEDTPASRPADTIQDAVPAVPQDGSPAAESPPQEAVFSSGSKEDKQLHSTVEAPQESGASESAASGEPLDSRELEKPTAETAMKQAPDAAENAAPQGTTTESLGAGLSRPASGMPGNPALSERMTLVKLRVLESLKRDTFAYEPKDMIDPFVSFITQPEPPPMQFAQDNDLPQMPPEPRKPLTPLQRMTLVEIEKGLRAILWGDMGRRAIIEDPTGKGFIVTEGTPASDKNGVITEIFNDSIVIQQEIWDPRARRMHLVNSVIKLKKTSATDG